MSLNGFLFASKKYKNIYSSICMQIIRNIYDKSNEVFDIIIIGGGMVGTTLACALAKNRHLESKKILLIEENNKHKYKFSNQYSNRVIALNKHSRLLLSNIEAWKHIQSVRFTPVYKMQVWDACSEAMITFSDNNLSQELAYIVENDLLLHAVQTELSKKKLVKILNNAKIKQIILSNNGKINSKVQLESGEKFIAKLLIGADGQKSKVRQVMGVQYIDWEYDQMGIVATVKLSKVTKNVIAWQRFLPTGTIALLPLTDSLSSLVLCIKMEEAKQLLNISEEEFVNYLNIALYKVYSKNNVIKIGVKVFEKFLQNFQLQSDISKQIQPTITSIVKGSRAAFPLGFGHAVHYVQPGVALIGDAAHRINPLAGQGVNLGFGDVKALVQILAEGVTNGALIGDITYLHKYESIRQWDNIPTMLAIDIIFRLHNSTTPPIVLGRSLGLQLINAMKPVKRFLMQHAADSKNINRW